MSATPSDVDVIRATQQEAWAAGNYASIATRIVPIAEQLPETADLQAGWRVLDVATGTGNAALAAARHNTDVTGLDYVPRLLEHARARAEVEGLDVRWVEGVAEDLPFPDESFDAVLSIFGVMFAPDHTRAADELLRVCRPGGRIAMCNWVADSFIGHMFETIAKYNPPPPGLTSPIRWGEDAYLQELFGGRARLLSSQKKTFHFRYETPEGYPERLRNEFGPMIKTYEVLDSDGQDALTRDLIDLSRSFDRNQSEQGPVAIAADYMETVFIRE